MTVSLADLQAFLRQVATQQYEAVALAGLTVFFDPRDDLPFFNYAIPDADWAEAVGGSLPRMRAECAVRGRQARFEFIDEYAPGLDALLRAAGFVEEARQQLMVVTPDQFRAAQPVAGLRIDELDGAASLEDLRALLTIQRRGFDPGGAGEATGEEARHFARTLGQGRAFVARVQGEAAAAGMYSTPLEVGPGRTRAAEIAGLATLAPFRRRGIATALTARAVQSAFEQGADVVCLVVDSARSSKAVTQSGAVLAAFSEMVRGEPPALQLDDQRSDMVPHELPHSG